MTLFIKFIIRYRFFVLGLLLIITAGFGYIASQGVIASSIGHLFFGDDHPEYGRYKKRIREFANDEVFIVAYHDPEFLLPQKLHQLDAVIQKIKEIPDVGRVDSIINAQHTFAREDTLFVKKYAEEVIDRPDRMSKVHDSLMADDMLTGLVISSDGDHIAVIVELEPDDQRAVERGPLVVDEVLVIFKQAGFESANLHRVGLIATLSEVMVQTRFNLTRLFPYVCIVLLIVLYVLFHRFWPVLITLVVALIAVVWTTGFAVLLDRNISIFIAMAPVVILIVTTSDVIHLCSAYMLELGRGKTKEAAIYSSGHDVGTACLMTSATTFVGFVSLSMVPVPAFKQMGWVLGFGVAVALLLAMTLTPILFWLMKQPEPWNDEVSRSQRLLTRLLSSVQRTVRAKPVLIVCIFAIGLAASFWGLIYLTIETDFSKRLDTSNSIRIDEKFYNRKFAGSNFLEVFISTPEPEGLLDPDVFSRVIAFQQTLEQMPEVDSVVSVVDLIETIDRELNSGQSFYAQDALTRQLLAQYLLLFEMSGGEDLDRLANYDYQTMRMAVRLSDTRVRFTFDLGNRVRRVAHDIFGDTAFVHATGLTYLMGMFLDEIINGQRMGLVFAFVSILLLMIIWMKSVRIGLWSMLPNLLPILVLGGFLGWFYDEIDSDTITIAMIAIGIGVDDTIHFLMRWRSESTRSSDSAAALDRTFHFSGRAIIITTVILTAGFAPFALSDYYSVRIMGTLLPLTLVVALLADLLFVPALLQLGVMQTSTLSKLISAEVPN
ncbi:MAG: MMPL family transporter [Deltaproteobacteria bacterium]|jgi:predicted RND superfamily exporter protein|nr:MMPL family transporter [Deltaproteobacteria bacterium]